MSTSRNTSPHGIVGLLGKYLSGRLRTSNSVPFDTIRTGSSPNFIAAPACAMPCRSILSSIPCHPKAAPCDGWHTPCHAALCYLPKPFSSHTSQGPSSAQATAAKKTRCPRPQARQPRGAGRATRRLDQRPHSVVRSSLSGARLPARSSYGSRSIRADSSHRPEKSRDNSHPQCRSHDSRPHSPPYRPPSSTRLIISSPTPPPGTTPHFSPCLGPSAVAAIPALAHTASTYFRTETPGPTSPPNSSH